MNYSRRINELLSRGNNAFVETNDLQLKEILSSYEEKEICVLPKERMIFLLYPFTFISQGFFGQPILI